jgi:hypothetical protein
VIGHPSTAGRTFLETLGLALLCLVVMGVGCGKADDRDMRKTAPDARRSDSDSAVRSHKWELVRVRGERILIGALVNYCESRNRFPRIEYVKRLRKPGAIVLTMTVRFPPHPEGCFGSQGSLLHWVEIGPRIDQVDIYDGSSSPPARRRKAPKG